MILTLKDLLAHARARSRFYQGLFASLPDETPDLAALPIPRQEDFWAANTIEDNRLLTGPMRDGIVFKSGGTTGSPKFSVFSQEEWRVFVQEFGRGMAAGGLEAGDRVGNLFYGGELYGSFVFIGRSMDEAPVGVLQFPIAGSTALPEMAKLIRAYSINVLAGVPTTILNLAEHVRGLPKRGSFKVSKILFGGESMYEDQRQALDEVFPGVRILSVGYASTDAGILGYADPSCGRDEHRLFSSQTILEIVDEDTGSPIAESGRPGKVVVTNLTRTLMPVIRYPVGDRAMWVEEADAAPATALSKGDRRFRLLGRSEEGARVGPVTLYVEDVRKALEGFQHELGISNFQLVIVHREKLDQLVLRIAAHLPAARLAARSGDVIREIHRQRPFYEEAVRDGKVLPIAVEWVEPSALTVNPRTGKLKRVIDERFKI